VRLDHDRAGEAADPHRGGLLDVVRLVAVQDVAVEEIPTAVLAVFDGRPRRERGRVAVGPGAGGHLAIGLDRVEIDRDQRPVVEAQVSVRVGDVEPALCRPGVDGDRPGKEQAIRLRRNAFLIEIARQTCRSRDRQQQRHREPHMFPVTGPGRS
jgi:hypothetical protein